MRRAVHRIAFCATGKTGLGHLRRVTNIVAELHRCSPDLELVLLTNASLDGLHDSERALYSLVTQVPRQDMAERLRKMAPAAVVVDTAVLPGLHAVEAPLSLVLRETVPAKLADFRLERGRPWNLVIVPNPQDEWLPAANAVPSDRLSAVGWIYRQARKRPQELDLGSELEARTVLLASGGGGNVATQAAFRGNMESLVSALRAIAEFPLSILQVVGARAGESKRAPGVDRIVCCGSALNEAFTQVDLVVSTVGYNSVLELACSDVPVMLAPIARTFDDQDERADVWGARLGMRYNPFDPFGAARWMAGVLERRARRKPVDLGPSGAAAAARLIEGLSR